MKILLQLFETYFGSKHLPSLFLIPLVSNHKKSSTQLLDGILEEHLV